MKVELLPESLCPTCGYQMDSATVVGPAEPHRHPASGDVSLCLRCGEVLEFDAQGKLQVPTLAAMTTWDKTTHDLVSRVQKLIRAKRPLATTTK